jgi:hypothetical protein
MCGWHVSVVVVLQVVVWPLWGVCLWAAIWGCVDTPPGGMRAWAVCAQCCDVVSRSLAAWGCVSVGGYWGTWWYAARGRVCGWHVCVVVDMLPGGVCAWAACVCCCESVWLGLQEVGMSSSHDHFFDLELVAAGTRAGF